MGAGSSRDVAAKAPLVIGSKGKSLPKDLSEFIDLI